MKIFCIGIQGIGLSGVANILHSRGHDISGVDPVSSDITDHLKRKGVGIVHSHREENISSNLDLIIYSEAVPTDNPERLRAAQLGIRQMSFAQSLQLLSTDKKVIAISGTHGKTTITGMLTAIFLQTHLDPQIIIGSKMPQLSGQNYKAGSGDCFLVEACEYRRNFLSLTPHIVLMNSLEPDHLDYYKDEADYISAYQELAERMSKEGTVIIHRADRTKLDESKIAARVTTIEQLSQGPPPKLQIPGEHNRKNAQAARAVASCLEIKEGSVSAGLESFIGTLRRLEHKGQLNGAEVYDDYAHHPKEIQATLQAVKEKYPTKNIIAVFQPHQFSRTRKMKDEFAKSFRGVKKVYIPSIYKVRDKQEDVEAITAHLLSEAINAYNESESIPEAQLKAHLKSKVSSSDIVLVMGAGNITQFASSLVEA
jgi:UDP-N-acetylmuramate--alanine ligase